MTALLLHVYVCIMYMYMQKHNYDYITCTCTVHVIIIMHSRNVTIHIQCTHNYCYYCNSTIFLDSKYVELCHLVWLLTCPMMASFSSSAYSAGTIPDVNMLLINSRNPS